MGHEPDLIPNYTVIIQLAIFLATFGVLRFFVFRPYLALLHRRQEKTEGLMAMAAAAREKSEKLRLEYEIFMREERKKLGTWMEEERKKIAEDERRVLQQARNSVGEELQALRKNIQAEISRVERQFSDQVPEYASLVVSKLLGHQVATSLIPHDTTRMVKAELS